jgi:hypothetical protein
MRKPRFVFLNFVAFSAVASAGAITISASDDLSSAPWTAAGASGYSLSCTSAGCFQGGPGSGTSGYSLSSYSDAFGVAQVSASAPTTLGDPLILSADGSFSGSASGRGFSTISPDPTTAPVTTLYLYPTISIDFAPGGSTGEAEATINNSTSGLETLGIDAYMTGNANGSFSFDPSTGVMSLVAPAGDSGDVLVGGVGVTLILFEFENGIVTASQNSLGLVLPAVGASASFQLTSVPQFQASFPSSDDYDLGGSVTIDATITTPEPGSFFLALAALGAFFRRRAKIGR